MRQLSFCRTLSPSQAAAGADVDVTPVMNLFVILIPYLISMAVFAHLALIEFNLPPNVGANLQHSDAKPILKLTVVVTPDYCAITHGETMLDSLPLEGGGYQFDAFKEALIVRRAQAQVQDEVIVAARDEIRFNTLVRVMDRCREAGFSRLSVSSAPEAVARLP